MRDEPVPSTPIRAPTAGPQLDAAPPRLRGWLHAIAFPVVVVAGAVLVWVAPTTRTRVGMLAFAFTAALLFGTSALYHRGSWSPRAALALRRVDHANIFLIIAGTYTAFASTLLSPEQAATLLTIMWACAAAGIVFKIIWVHAPRWLSTPLYVAMGWVAAFYLQPLYEAGGLLVLGLIVVGGVLYTLGAAVFGFKRPNPSHHWFGFHELFHALTLLAFAAHFAAASLAMARLGPTS